VRLGATSNIFNYSPTLVQYIKNNYGGSAQASVTNYRNTLGTAMFGYNMTTSSSTTFSDSIRDDYISILSINAYSV